MFFCTVCNTSYNIKKSVDVKILQDGGEISERKVIEQLVEKNIVDTSILQKIDLKKLENKEYFKQLSQYNKEYVYNVIYHQQIKKPENMVIQNIKNKAYFQCSKCGNQENIKEKTMIFSETLKSDQQNIVEDSDYIIHDKTLPRTKQYKCVNEKCKTHKMAELKEAVFYRQRNSYQVIYVCTVCKSQWKNV